MKATILLDIPEETASRCSEIAGIPVTVNRPDDADIQIGMRGFVPTTRLKAVQTISAGVDHIDFAKFPPGVEFFSNAGAFSDSVAQHAFALILEHSNRICHFNSMIRNGTYRKEPVYSLFGRTLGVLGYGGIGRSCGRIAKGLGMKVLAYTRSPKEDGIADSFESSPEILMEKSDVIIIGLPLTASTRNMVGRELLSRFHGTMIVNVARADIVHEQSMRDYLSSHREVAYLTDVWWNEPEVKLPLPENAVLTPHVAGISQDSMESALMRACANVKLYLQGKAEHRVDVSEYTK